MNNNKMIIVPYMSVGKIYFGMTRSEVQLLLGKPDRAFFKTKDSKTLTEMFLNLSCFVYYNVDDKVEAIEAWNSCNIIIDKINLFREPYNSLVQKISKLDPEVKMNTDGFTSLKKGFSIWIEDEIKDDSLCSSIIIFDKKYYIQ